MRGRYLVVSVEIGTTDDWLVDEDTDCMPIVVVDETVTYWVAEMVVVLVNVSLFLEKRRRDQESR